MRWQNGKVRSLTMRFGFNFISSEKNTISKKGPQFEDKGLHNKNPKTLFWSPILALAKPYNEKTKNLHLG